MATVDEVDQIRVALMEHAAKFFADVRTPEDLYTRLKLCFNTMREEMAIANTEGRVTPGMAEAWSWYSLAVPSILSVIFQDPKFGTRQLEVDLNDAFVRALRSSSTTAINKPAEPTVRAGSAIYAQPEIDPGKKLVQH
jgi:hypothetical protein